ncbi:MAG: 16S rRNA (guanine(966)-N(2))-methyltransferase RsmD [Vulcanimicrobiota bacterium]
MKIIAGKFKGKTLPYRQRRGVRVTSQLVKEALFSIVAEKVPGAQVLDLYCGSGSLSMEALSRGADFVTCVDIDGQNLKQLKYFLEEFGLENQATLIKKDAIKAVKHQPEHHFDLIILDPPYHIKREIPTLEAIDKHQILKPDGICVLEHYSQNETPGQIGKLIKIKEKNYGDSALSIYSYSAKEETLEEEEAPEKDEINESES